MLLTLLTPKNLTTLVDSMLLTPKILHTLVWYKWPLLYVGCDINFTLRTEDDFTLRTEDNLH